MRERLFISTVASRVGLNPRTLRYYENIGLLPSPSRTAAGYRLYSSTIFERLDFIQKAQTLGLTLAEIREILAVRDSGSLPCAHVAQQITEKIEAIEKKIVELEELKKTLSALLLDLRTAQTSSGENAICPHIQRIERGKRRNGSTDQGGEQ